MATEDLVTEQFQFLGIEVEKDVLMKCVHLCHVYGIDAESFVEQWMAFSLTNLNGEPPSVKYLDVLERKEFSKRAAELAPASAIKQTSTPNAGTNLTIYGAPDEEQPETEVLANYMTTTPKRVKREKEPSNQNELQPATYSPTVGHSAKFASRTNAGSVVHSYGDEELLQILAKPTDISNTLSVNISQVPNDDGDIFSKAMFGFELLHEKASVFDNHIRYISQCIMKKAGITETSSVRYKSQAEVVVAGRIECDADARLNPKCVVMQGTWDESLSQAVPVDLDNVAQYALFPGQVAVVRGGNPRGDRFLAREVLADAAAPPPDVTDTFTGAISIVAVAGPYTTSDNLSYEPLKDLVAYIGAHRPHVVLMTGPFLDSDHAKVKDNTMAETYKSFFEKLVDSLDVSGVSPHTKIYILSSHRDAFHVNIYPTLPYSSRRKHPGVHFVPDPCTLNINGLLVGITSTDVLMHISQEEISFGAGGDKLARLASHLLAQQSYWPLWPPPPALRVDAALWAQHAQMPATPHLLVLPSNFRYFVKEVNGCVVVNPERLAKGEGGGTLARLRLRADVMPAKRVAAQIVRI